MRKEFAWTGHRPDLFDDVGAARAAVERLAEAVRGEARGFLVGGQRGVDTWAAQAAARIGVPYVVILPCAPDEFADGWSEADRRAFDELVAVAAEVRIAGGYTPRNRALATEADELIAIWTGVRGGGTAETIDFARAAGTPVREVLLAPAADAGHASGRGI